MNLIITPSLRPRAWRDSLAVLLVVIGMMLGGGGSPAVLPELALQLIAVALFAVWLLSSQSAPWREIPAQARIVAALALALPLLQLVPLPPAIWQSLPGRELLRDSLALAGAANAWWPVSLTPARTLAALLAMVPPVLVLCLVAALPLQRRGRVIAGIGAVALLSMVVGAIQIKGGPDGLFSFYATTVRDLSGFQANRNSAADVLVIGMVAVVAALREWDERRPRPMPAAATLAVTVLTCIVFAIGVLLTASRAGIALFPVGLAAVAALVWPAAAPRGKTIAFASAGFALAALLAFGALANNRSVGNAFARFTFEREFRVELWRDTLFAAQAAFPTGTGIGSFAPVVMAAERLEVVDPTVPHRAHNDYLEWLLEAGLPGMLVLCAIAFMVVAALAAQWRGHDPSVRRQTIFAVAALSIIALHSIVDYPLRSMSLAMLAAASAALAFTGGTGGMAKAARQLREGRE